MRKLRLLVPLALFVASLVLVPARVCARDADAYFDGDADCQDRLARGVTRWIDEDANARAFHTGSELFDGEWLFGTYMMAAMGYGQLALERPESRAVMLPRMERAIERMLSPEARRFDRDRWGEDALESLASSSDHAAYLGYANLALSLHRQLEPVSRFAALNDAITEALARRIASTPRRLLLTYPDETFPVDNTAVIGSIGLHDRAVGTSHGPLLAQWDEALGEYGIDRSTGLMIQAVRADGSARDDARGSGTCLGAYFLSFSHPARSRALWEATRTHLLDSVLGFGVVREYPAAAKNSGGDIDSGPIVFGFGVSATGFGIGAARASGDREAYARLYSTMHLFGAPIDGGEARSFVTGGPLGNSLAFAMLTAGGAHQ